MQGIQQGTVKHSRANCSGDMSPPQAPKGARRGSCYQKSKTISVAPKKLSGWEPWLLTDGWDQPHVNRAGRKPPGE